VSSKSSKGILFWIFEAGFLQPSAFLLPGHGLSTVLVKMLALRLMQFSRYCQLFHTIAVIVYTPRKCSWLKQIVTVSILIGWLL